MTRINRHELALLTHFRKALRGMSYEGIMENNGEYYRINLSLPYPSCAIEKLRLEPSSDSDSDCVTARWELTPYLPLGGWKRVSIKVRMRILEQTGEDLSMEAAE